MRKTVLYIIESLGLGGAEMLVVSQLPEVHKRYNVILVTLKPGNEFLHKQVVCDKYYCLNMSRKIDLVNASKKLKKIIQENNVLLVHSVLYWSVLVARIACNKKIPHVCSLATIMSKGAYTARWYSRYAWLLDKLTHNKKEIVIGSSNEVLRDFDKAIGTKGESKVLYNFVNDEFFDKAIEYQNPSAGLKLVAVGNLKEVKNYQYLVEAFKFLKDENVSIDIFGQGHLYEVLKKQIDTFELKINLMGVNNNISEILPRYHAYVMCSDFEGFGIAAAEAMAIGLPLLLSDVEVLREISKGNGFYFNPKNPEDFIQIIKKILHERLDLKVFSEKGKQIAKDNYTKASYMKGLFQIFDNALLANT